MTISLEHIQEGDWAAVNRAVDQLRSLVLDTGGVSLGIRIGTSTLTFAGGTQAASLAGIAHGLGRLPKGAVGWAINTPVNLFTWGGALTSTTFAIAAMTTAAAPAAGTTATIFWVVIG